MQIHMLRLIVTIIVLVVVHGFSIQKGNTSNASKLFDRMTEFIEVYHFRRVVIISGKPIIVSFVYDLAGHSLSRYSLT